MYVMGEIWPGKCLGWRSAGPLSFCGYQHGMHGVSCMNSMMQQGTRTTYRTYERSIVPAPSHVATYAPDSTYVACVHKRKKLDLDSLCDEITRQGRDNQHTHANPAPLWVPQPANQTRRALTSLHQARHKACCRFTSSQSDG